MPGDHIAQPNLLSGPGEIGAAAFVTEKTQVPATAAKRFYENGASIEKRPDFRSQAQDSEGLRETIDNRGRL